MAETLEAALDELRENLKLPIRELTGQDGNIISSIQTNIREQAEIVVEIVQADLAMLSDNNQNAEETNKQLSPFYKIALRNHYFKMVETLNAALKDQDPKQQKKHADKLEELANISKPRLKAALHALAGYFAYIAGLFTAAQIGSLITLAPATYGGSLLATVPVSMVADEMKKKGKDFFKKSEEYSQGVQAIQKTQEKIARGKKQKR